MVFGTFMCCIFFFFLFFFNDTATTEIYTLTHSFPTRRSSDLDGSSVHRRLPRTDARHAPIWSAPTSRRRPHHGRDGNRHDDGLSVRLLLLAPRGLPGLGDDWMTKQIDQTTCSEPPESRSPKADELGHWKIGRAHV